MKIVQVEAVPLVAKFEDIYGGKDKVPTSLLVPAASHTAYPRYGQYATLVKITTDDGMTGIGEAYGLPNANITSVIINELLRPMLIDKDPKNIFALWNMMYSLPKLGGESRGFMMEAISGVDMALWDLKGKMTNLPVHTLIGGKINDRIPCYASPVMYFADPSDSQKKAKEYVEQGFRAIKLKVGRSIETDIAHIAAVRKAIGPDIDLLLDVNCAYDVRTAIEFAREAEPYGIYWLEEPIPPEDIDGLKTIHRAIRMPLAVGENEFTVNLFREMFKQGAVDVIMPNVARAGGITGVVQINMLAKAFSVKLAPHGVGSGMNIAAAIQVMAAFDNSLIFEYNQLLNPLRHDIVDPFPRFEKGALIVPDKPGLGVSVNKAVVEKYRV